MVWLASLLVAIMLTQCWPDHSGSPRLQLCDLRPIVMLLSMVKKSCTDLKKKKKLREIAHIQKKKIKEKLLRFGHFPDHGSPLAATLRFWVWERMIFYHFLLLSHPGLGEDGCHEGGGAGQADQGCQGGIQGWWILKNLVLGSFAQEWLAPGWRIYKSLSERNTCHKKKWKEGFLFLSLPRWRQLLEGPKTFKSIWKRGKLGAGGSFLVLEYPQIKGFGNGRKMKDREGSGLKSHWRGETQSGIC